MVSMRTCLKIYCFVLGVAVSFSAFVWVAFQVYALSMTASGQTDLIVGRYLDISFGLLGLSSSLALLYGAMVESKSWISVWTLGSATVVVGFWAWFFYRRYGIEHPESYVEAQSLGFALTVWYGILLIPVVAYAKCLRSNRHTFREWAQEVAVAGEERPLCCFGTYFGGTVFSRDACRNFFCAENRSSRGTQSPRDGFDDGGGKAHPTAPANLLFVNKKVKHNTKPFKSPTQPCQIVTADGYKITISKDEDLYNPV